MLEKYWVRLTQRDKDNKLYFWIYLMFIGTLAPGIGFAFFGTSNSVSSSVLFQLTAIIGEGLIPAWGFVCIAAVILGVAHLLIRKKWLGSVGSMVGFLAWTYAFTFYAIGGYWIQGITAAIWMVFWAVHHIRINRYYQEIKTGKINMVP